MSQYTFVPAVQKRFYVKKPSHTRTTGMLQVSSSAMWPKVVVLLSAFLSVIGNVTGRRAGLKVLQVLVSPSRQVPNQYLESGHNCFLSRPLQWPLRLNTAWAMSLLQLTNPHLQGAKSFSRKWWEIHRLLRNTKFQYCVRKSPLLDAILSQTNLDHIFKSHSSKRISILSVSLPKSCTHLLHTKYVLHDAPISCALITPIFGEEHKLWRTSWNFPQPPVTPLLGPNCIFSTLVDK
jgi:hypothetical protein